MAENFADSWEMAQNSADSWDSTTPIQTLSSSVYYYDITLPILSLITQNVQCAMLDSNYPA